MYENAKMSVHAIFDELHGLVEIGRHIRVLRVDHRYAHILEIRVVFEKVVNATLVSIIYGERASQAGAHKQRT